MGKKSQVLIVGFAFATPSTAHVNKILRIKIEKLIEKFFRDGAPPVYTQPDLADGLGFDVEVIPEKAHQPSPTLRIARGAVQYAKRLGITQIRVVAAKPHMWRCVRDLEMALREEGFDIPVIAEDIPELSWWDWFHPSSTQPRTRSPWAWLRRDGLLWLMPFWIYKRIAS